MSAPVRFVDRAATLMGTSGVAALRRGADGFGAARQAAMDDYPAMEEMRDRARSARLDALAHLDELLDRLADGVEAQGGHVHFAADAAEANGIVTRLALAAGAGRAVKSKSMVTEEIGLNTALESAGVEVVETDLGEFIAQLSGDHPSHIIAPVLHQTRHEIGELFVRRLGFSYTDEPTELTALARAHLRRRFLDAEVGISGVNMAAAEGGVLALVTNEGNGRLVSTAPRAHIAIMGMERVVRTFEDLAVVLEVLARSATGQRLSVYTNLLAGPRRAGEPDGPDELHLVVVDNGRTRILAGPTAEILICIRCGACLNVCPVYRQVGGHAYGSIYPGPVGAVVTPGLGGLDAHWDLPVASTLCGACEEVCPVRIPLPDLLVELRRQGVEDGHLPGWLRRGVGAFAYAAGDARRWRLAARAGGLAARAGGSERWIKRLPWHGAAWTDHRDLPRPATEPFHRWWEKRRAP